MLDFDDATDRGGGKSRGGPRNFISCCAPSVEEHSDQRDSDFFFAFESACYQALSRKTVLASTLTEMGGF